MTKLAPEPPSSSADFGTHTSAVFSTDEVRARTAARFLRQGLERGERVQYLSDGAHPDEVIDALTAHGLDARRARDRGQLVVATAQETFLAAPPFDPDRLIGHWHTSVVAALADGYPGLRAVEDMSWSARGLPGAERLLEYELRMHGEVLGRLPLSALCLYDRRVLRDTAVAVLEGAHPSRMRGEGEKTGTPVLSVTPLPGRPGLRMTGAANHDSRPALEAAAAALSRLESEGAVLDLSGLDHIDAASLGSLAAAATRSPGSRLAVHGAPPSLVRLLELFPELTGVLEVTPR
ncbi:hypothetical protein GCM10027168_24850 [Streptomyces capparidis]